MLILNISYNDPRVKRALEAECGPPFGFWQGVRRGGVGSPRFELVDAPAALLEAVDRPDDRGFCSLEMRPRGLVVRFRSRLETLAVPAGWAPAPQVELGSPGAGLHAPLRLTLACGERLHFRLRREHWGTVNGLFRRLAPPGILKVTAASGLR